MKMILDLELVVSELGISPESYAKWKAANLDSAQADGSHSWTLLDDSGYAGQCLHKTAERRIG